MDERSEIPFQIEPSIREPGRNMNDWAVGMNEVDPKISAELNEPRTVGFEGVEKLGLPRYKRKVIPLNDFIANPQQFLSDMDSEKFYITLMPKRKDLPRKRTSGITADGVNDFIHTEISSEDVEFYDLILQQYFDNLYGGNIVINPSGQIYAEFSPGKQGPVSKGTVTPEFIVKRDRITRLFKYSFEDQHLRKVAYKTITSIPHEGEGREMEFPTGYYEFVIVKKEDDGPEEPIFIDYRNNKAHLLPDEN